MENIKEITKTEGATKGRGRGPGKKQQLLIIAIAKFHALRNEIIGPGAAKAWRIANAMLDDSATPARTKWDICKTFLALAGHVAPKAREAPGEQDKPLVERSTADLKAMCEQLEAELAGRAIPVSATVSASIAAQAVDMYS